MKNGADGRIRTGDLLITNQLLYQLSYIGENGVPWGTAESRGVYLGEERLPGRGR